MAQEQDAKGAFIEKLLFALLPLIIAGVGYLLNAVSTLNHQVTILESKTSLVVTADNKQAKLLTTFMLPTIKINSKICLEKLHHC